MRSVGIIAEYNPLHTGHKYHIQKARRMANADYTVVVMSPDFVQRGTPAIFDKYTRTRMALLAGADLVLELPICYATGSAEYFARGAIGMLDALGCVDTVCFGSETADGNLLSQLADILVLEPPVYQDVLRREQKAGKTFPQARATALAAVLADRDNEFLRQLSMPNNILALEYCKALQQLSSSILPLPILRQGNGYHDEALSDTFCSATALREALLQGQGPEEIQMKQRNLTSLLSYIPETCHPLFLKAARISPELSDRIRKLRFSCIGKSFAEITALLKTRQLTEARIRRALLHLTLDLQQSSLSCFWVNGTVFYARLLGFKKNAGPLLHAIRHSASIPLLAKPSNAETILKNFYSEQPDRLSCALEMLRMDFLASHRYEGVSSYKYNREFVPEFKKSPIIIE